MDVLSSTKLVPHAYLRQSRFNVIVAVSPPVELLNNPRSKTDGRVRKGNAYSMDIEKVPLKFIPEALTPDYS